MNIEDRRELTEEEKKYSGVEGLQRLQQHWLKYNIDLEKLMGNEWEIIQKAIGIPPATYAGRYFLIDQFLHGLNKLAYGYYLKEKADNDVFVFNNVKLSHNESVNAKTQQVLSMAHYMIDTFPSDWSTQRWIDFVGNSREQTPLA